MREKCRRATRINDPHLSHALSPFSSISSFSSPRIIHCSSSRYIASHSSACSALAKDSRSYTLGKLNFNSTRSTSRSRETFASPLRSIYSRNNQSFSVTEEFGVSRSRSDEIQSTALNPNNTDNEET